jgi:integrase
VIFIGPRGQDVLQPYLLRGQDDFCFSPADSERKRRQIAHEQRTTPLTCGNLPGTNRTRKPRRQPGERYTPDSYRRAIERACDLAFPPASDHELTNAELKAWRKLHRWSPNQLRHSAATEIRRRFGLEAAQVTLGHASADVTQVYAERDLEKARYVMREVG